MILTIFLPRSIPSLQICLIQKIGLKATRYYFYILFSYFIDKALTSPLSSIRSTQIFTEKISALERQKQIGSMHEPLLWCLCLTWTWSPTQTHLTTTKSSNHSPVTVFIRFRAQTVCFQACYHPLPRIEKTCSVTSYDFCVCPAFRTPLCCKDFFLPFDALNESVGKRLEK